MALHTFTEGDDGRIFNLLLFDGDQPNNKYFQDAKQLLGFDDLKAA